MIFLYLHSFLNRVQNSAVWGFGGKYLCGKMSSYSRFSILDEVFQARKFFGSCHSNLAWGFINTLLAIIIYLEM